jgi:hypothetical protein
MKRMIIVFFGLMALSACSTASTFEPIPGSIIYGGQPRTKLTKAPVGSTFTHGFTNQSGQHVVETYRIAPNRDLQLIDRQIWQDIPGFGED